MYIATYRREGHITSVNRWTVVRPTRAENVIQRHTLRRAKKQHCSLTTLNISCKRYSSRDSNYASRAPQRMINWLYNLFVTHHKKS